MSATGARVQFLSVAPRSVLVLPSTSLARYSMRRGDAFGRHEHDVHQLSWSPTGVLQISTDERTWTISPMNAVWLDAGVAHDVVCLRDATLHSLYVRPSAHAAAGSMLVEVGRLLAELIAHVADEALPGVERAHAERVIFDIVRPAASDRTSMAMSTDERARRVATGLLREPADQRSIAEWGREVGASGRTLARHFVAETGLTFANWRTQLRVRTAMGLLAQDLPVAVVAQRVGYRNTSAFSTMFTSVTGERPSHFGADLTA